MTVRVPWHHSLFLRLFALGALIAVVAVAAATWATVRSTTVAVHQEQQQTLHADAAAYDALLGYAARHRSWAGAESLVARLARQAGHRVTVTDDTGRVLLDSTGAVAPRDVTRARATIDALDVDPALVPGSARPTPSPSPSPVASAAQRCGSTGCLQDIAAPAWRIDSRVRGPFDPDHVDRAVWSALTERVDACLARGGLPPVTTINLDFTTVVATSRPAGEIAPTVTDCVASARTEMLRASVAPRALLYVGDGDPSADVGWDLSDASKLRIALLAAAVLLVTLLLSALLSAYVVRPLRGLAGAATRAGDGDLSVRVDEHRRDEIGQMARAFNRMADRREQLEEARRRMVSDVSHELRNPLANIRGWLEAAQDGLAETDARLLASLHEETTQLQRLVDDLHQLSVGDAGELRLTPEPIDLTAFTQQVVDAFSGSASATGVTLTATASPGASVLADPLRLRQAVGNLVANALRHTPRGGQVTVAGEQGLITVSDDGEGIATGDLETVFDRFSRVDGSRSRATGGSGLGLAIVRQIVEAHGGTATVESALGVGTTVSLHLPG